MVEDESGKVVSSGGFYRVSDEPGIAESEEEVTKGEDEIRKTYRYIFLEQEGTRYAGGQYK